VSGAKARVGYLLIEVEGLYVGEAPKTRLEALSRPWGLNEPK